ASTLAGGAFAVRLRAHLPLVLSFTTGVVLGVVSFDLLPEVFQLVHDNGVSPLRPMLGLVSAFLLFRMIEELILAQAHRVRGTAGADDRLRSRRRHPDAGRLAAVALIGHSTFDGVSIGLAFQISSGVGVIVAIAVIAHDFADGINTVSVMIAHGNSLKHAVSMLAADAIAPIVGAISTFFFVVRPEWLVAFLGFFAGFLLHVSTSSSHTIPPGHSRGRILELIGVTTVGAAFALVVSRFAP
ncbi:MAG: ZIP family metal transporter, partial [Gemmatimonadaceae bacterium]